MSMKEKESFIIPLIFFTILVGVIVYQKVQYFRIMKSLTSVDVQQVTIFNIYRRWTLPVGVPVEFNPPAPIIDEFFQSLTDLRSSWPQHDTVASQTHNWSLEIVAGGKTIQMRCYVPSRKGNIVVGEIGKFSKNHVSHYGYFQSRNLFHWYQTYSHRWLESDGSE